MILADLHDGKRDWNKETRTNSLTSGPRSPTKMEYSGPRSSLRCRLAKPRYIAELFISCEGAVLPSVSEPTARGPVKLEWSVAIRDLATIQLESLGGSLRGLEINEAISGTSTRLRSAASSLVILRLIYLHWESRLTH